MEATPAGGRSTRTDPAFLTPAGGRQTFDVVIANFPFSAERWWLGAGPAASTKHDGGSVTKAHAAYTDPFGRFLFGKPPAESWGLRLRPAHRRQPGGRRAGRGGVPAGGAVPPFESMSANTVGVRCFRLPPFDFVDADGTGGEASSASAGSGAVTPSNSPGRSVGGGYASMAGACRGGGKLPSKELMELQAVEDHSKR